MTVYELMYLFLDSDFQRFRLYDIVAKRGLIIFDGFLRDLPFKYEGLKVHSIDNITGKTIVLNVETTEE